MGLYKMVLYVQSKLDDAVSQNILFIIYLTNKKIKQTSNEPLEHTVDVCKLSFCLLKPVTEGNHCVTFEITK